MNCALVLGIVKHAMQRRVEIRKHLSIERMNALQWYRTHIQFQGKMTTS